MPDNRSKRTDKKLTGNNLRIDANDEHLKVARPRCPKDGTRGEIRGTFAAMKITKEQIINKEEHKRYANK